MTDDDTSEQDTREVKDRSEKFKSRFSRGRDDEDDDEEHKSESQNNSQPESQTEPQTESLTESHTESSREESAEEVTRQVPESQLEEQTSPVMRSVISDSVTDEGTGSIKDEKKHVNMYLDETLAGAINARFDELNKLSKQQRGRPLEKNRDYYPAVFEAAFSEDKTVVEVLGLEK